MKKLLSFILAFAMVFSLMSAFTLLVGAETLSPNWTELTPWNVDDAGQSEGTVTVDGNSIVLGVPAGMWWPQAGVKFADMVDVDGLEIVFNATAFTDESPNGYFAITISTDPLGDFGNNMISGEDNILGARTYGATYKGKALSVTFYGSQLKMWVNNISTDADYHPVNVAGVNHDVTLSFHDTMDGLRMKVNGNDVQVEEEDEVTGDFVKKDLIIPEGEYVSGQAYLTFSAVGYGRSGSEAIAIKTINGVPANQFNVFADYCPNGHLFGDWEITKYPTNEEAGEMTRTCPTCGATETKDIPAIVLSDYNYYVSYGKAIITDYIGDGEDVVIPAEIAGCPVTAIGQEAFLNKDFIKSVVIPYGVVTINASAFNSCTGLKNVAIPDSVEIIEDYAFSGCRSLKSVTIPDSVVDIYSGAFSGCTGLTSVTIPDSVTSISESAFSGCTGLTSITIPDSVTRIGSDAFAYCTGLTNITIPDSVTYIEWGAFESCTGLKSVTIPNSVTSIDSCAFDSCTGLTNITIPDSVTSIGEDAFYGCTGLKTVINCSDLGITKGSTENGYVAYYADEVIDHKTHDFSGWAETKAPTCSKRGENTRTCSVCGKVETQVIDKLPHTYTDWTRVKAPTCTEQGIETRSCSVCGASAPYSADLSWVELLAWDADAAGNSEGTVEATADGFISLEVEPGLWWPQAGVTTNTPVNVSDLEIVINCPEFTDPSPNGYFMISLSRVKPGDFGLYGPLGGRSYDINIRADKAICLSVFAGEYYALEGVVRELGGHWEGVAEATPGVDAVIKFVDCGEYLKISVNGQYLQSNNEDILIPKAAVTNENGLSWLAFSAVGYGSSGSDGPITVKYINGVPAASFDGAFSVGEFIRYIPALGHDWSNWQTVYAPTYESAGKIERVCANDATHTEEFNIPALSSGEYTVDAQTGKYTYEKDNQTLSFDLIYDKAVVLGAQYRTEGPAGIRFCTEVFVTNKNGGYTVDGNNTVTFDNIETYGTLIIPLDLIDDPADLVLTANGKISSSLFPSGIEYLNVVGQKYYHKFDNKIQFTAVLVGIPDAAPGGMNYDRDFVAVSYIKYKNGETVYSAPCLRNIEMLVNASV